MSRSQIIKKKQHNTVADSVVIDYINCVYLYFVNTNYVLYMFAVTDNHLLLLFCN